MLTYYANFPDCTVCILGIKLGLDWLEAKLKLAAQVESLIRAAIGGMTRSSQEK
jgi:hypothetical protein